MLNSFQNDDNNNIKIKKSNKLIRPTYWRLLHRRKDMFINCAPFCKLIYIPCNPVAKPPCSLY